MAQLLLDSMASEWEPDKYHDTHRQKVEALIESKRQGNEIVTGAEVAPASTKVVDLMEVLSASIESVQAQRTGTETGAATGPAASGGRKATRPTARATPIKKTTSIKKAAKTPARATSAKPAARPAKARPKAKPAPRRKAS
jgi:DNA end-binding protein Ku